jgi:oligoribonuclease (3'-5' exoribonuclease)
MHQLWFDTETTGKLPKIHCPLTAYFAVCDSNQQVIDELYLQMKPDDMSKLKVEQEAMDVNKINLQEHLADPATITHSEARVKLKNFLIKHKIKGKRKSYLPCGHNVAFDKDMVWEWIMPQEEFEEEVHYRTLDSSMITNFLKDIGFFPEEVGNLMSLVQYFNLPEKEAHTCKGDVLMNIDVYKSMKSTFTARKKDMIGSTNSLLEIIEE